MNDECQRGGSDGLCRTVVPHCGTKAGHGQSRGVTPNHAQSRSFGEKKDSNFFMNMLEKLHQNLGGRPNQIAHGRAALPRGRFGTDTLERVPTASFAFVVPIRVYPCPSVVKIKPKSGQSNRNQTKIVFIRAIRV
jgi:hypothetical protein